MNIRGWPLDRIMQLPDCCFGRRWPIFFSDKRETAGDTFYISEFALPERCVLWEINFNWEQFVPVVGAYVKGSVGIALGDILPANLVEFIALESMIPGADQILTGGRVLVADMHLKMKNLYQVSGRRVVVRFYAPGPTSWYATLGLIVSSIPTEVPDWLCSGRV